MYVLINYAPWHYIQLNKFSLVWQTQTFFEDNHQPITDDKHNRNHREFADECITDQFTFVILISQVDIQASSYCRKNIRQRHLWMRKVLMPVSTSTLYIFSLESLSRPTHVRTPLCLQLLSSVCYPLYSWRYPGALFGPSSPTVPAPTRTAGYLAFLWSWYNLTRLWLGRYRNVDLREEAGLSIPPL